MQICTLTQTHNHASILPLSILQTDALPAAQPTVSKLKALKAHLYAKIVKMSLVNLFHQVKLPRKQVFIVISKTGDNC